MLREPGPALVDTVPTNHDRLCSYSSCVSKDRVADNTDFFFFFGGGSSPPAVPLAFCFSDVRFLGEQVERETNE